MIDHDLLDDLAAAKLNYEQALVAETQAQETSKRALKALNDAQQALDAAVQALKAGAHPTSTWGSRSEPKAVQRAYNFSRPSPTLPAPGSAVERLALGAVDHELSKTEEVA